jgi:hypothetical protein
MMHYTLVWGVILTSHTPYAVYSRVLESRLAVLELQGDVGTLSQRQAWSDTIRASALQTLDTHHIHVIDRDQFSALINPERDLSDCVGMCAAEIAREVNAQWSLSGALIQSEKQAIITLKVHDASGQLLGIEQRLSVLSSLSTGLLSKMTRSLLMRSLKLSISSQNEREVDSVVLNNQGDDQEMDTSAHIERDKKQTSSDDPYSSLWISLNHRGDKTYCVSPLITQQQYQRCIDDHACTPTSTWGRCLTHPTDVVRCLNIQQALQFAQWSGGWIPSVQEWKLWAKQAQSQISADLPFEWVVPQSKRRRGEAKWRERHLKISPQRLRASSPITAYQLNSHDRRRLFSTRRAPLAFAVTDLSFRVMYLTSRCPPDVSSKPRGLE